MAYGYGYNNPFYHPSYFQQQNQQQQPIRIMLVSNEEEAKATPADLNGNPTFFYNKSMNKILTTIQKRRIFHIFYISSGKIYLFL